MEELQLECHAVDHARWADLEVLFESRGSPKYCWCMAWRKQPAEAKGAKAPQRNGLLKAALKTRVLDGTPIGILGYLNGDPVAWCSVAPRLTHRPMGGPENDGIKPEHVWSVTCFFVKRAFRGQGASGQLLEAAVAYARDQGARVVEAYPVDPDSPSYKFMGIVGLFEKTGFRRVGSAGKRRRVMRLELTEN